MAERPSLWLRALPGLGIAPGTHILAVAMSREAALLRLRAGGAAVTACDWHAAALARAVAAGLPPECVIPWDGRGMPVPAGSADVGMVDLAHIAGRASFTLAVSLCARALRPGGRLLVCGGNADGAGGAERRLREWFDGALVLAYGGGRRILESRVPAAASVAPPAPVAAEDVRLAGAALRLHPAEGVFARGLPDAATEQLVRAAADTAARHACDVGCGGGAAGIALLARGAARCAFVDENLLALEVARRNLELNGLLPRAEIVAADAALAVPGGPYDVVVCNPPFHDGPSPDPALGRAVVHRAWAAVAPRGRLFVVGHRFLRYEEEVGSLREVGGDRAFRVLAATRPAAGGAGRSGGRRGEP